MRWGQTRYFFRCRNNFLPRFLGLLTLGSPSLTCTPDLKPVNMEVGALVLNCFLGTIFSKDIRSLHFPFSQVVKPHQRRGVCPQPSTQQKNARHAFRYQYQTAPIVP